MATHKLSKAELIRMVTEQRHWIDSHGETLLGYRLRYDENADGIYEADVDKLRELEARLHRS